MTLFEVWLKKRESSHSSNSSYDARVSALYADLAVRKSGDRLAFEAAVEWWRRLLSDYCLSGVQRRTSAINENPTSNTEGDVLVLRCDQKLLEDLTLEEYGRPLGIGTVLAELQAASCAFQLDHFLGSSKPLSGPTKGSRSISSRVLSFAAVPLVWAFSQLTVSLGINEQESDASEKEWREARGEWVLWDSVEKLSSAITGALSSQPCLSPLDRIYSYASFKQNLVLPALKGIVAGGATVESTDISELDLSILIRHLTRDRSMAIADDHIIKFRSSRDDAEDTLTMAEHEKEIVRVRETYKELEKQIEDIEARIKERQGRIESSLRVNSKSQALSYLRSRKALEALRDKRVGALEVLHGVLLKIEQAASDVEVIKAYEASSASLKSLLKSEHLQPERIASSMEAMQESISDADEIRQAIELGQEGVGSAAGNVEIDPEEIERELAALRDEVAKEKAQVRGVESSTIATGAETSEPSELPARPSSEQAKSSPDRNESSSEKRQAIAA